VLNVALVYAVYLGLLQWWQLRRQASIKQYNRALGNEKTKERKRENTFQQYKGKERKWNLYSAYRQ